MNAALSTLTRHGALSQKWAGRVDALFVGLAEAEAKSVLPPEPQNEQQLEAALVALRA